MENQTSSFTTPIGELPHSVYIALGGNLGDRPANLQEAVDRLRAGGRIQVQQLSRLYETIPWGYADQPDFLNMVLLASTSFAPQELLAYLKEVEAEMGREAAFRNAPRPIDLDIIFYDNLVLDEEKLQIPHPRLRGRGFVLAPLADIAPDFQHPGLNLSVKELLTEVNLSEAGLKLYPAGQPPEIKPPHFLFVTGQLAQEWLQDYLSRLAPQLGFSFQIAALKIDVAAFITCRFVADKLILSCREQQTTDLLILPGFAGGDLAAVEQATRIKSVRGPTELADLESFLASLVDQHGKNSKKKLLELSERFQYTEKQLRAMQSRLTDNNIRIYSDGTRVFAFNNQIFGVAEPDERGLRALFRQLKIDDASHAYYIGREFHKAATAIRLGLFYQQDRELEYKNLIDRYSKND